VISSRGIIGLALTVSRSGAGSSGRAERAGPDGGRSNRDSDSETSPTDTDGVKVSSDGRGDKGGRNHRNQKGDLEQSTTQPQQPEVANRRKKGPKISPEEVDQGVLQQRRDTDPDLGKLRYMVCKRDHS
jgi:hypothetical protein